MYRPGNTYITDNALSMNGVFYDNVWLELNLMLQHGYQAPSGKAHADDTEDNNEGLPHVLLIWFINTCKELVHLVKKTSLLDTTLKQSVPTW